MHLCIYACVHVSVNASAHMLREKRKMSYVLPSHSRSYSLGTRLLTEPGARLAAKMPCNFPDPTPNSTRVIGVCSHAQIFIWVLAFRLRSSNLHSKCSYPLSHISALPPNSSSFCIYTLSAGITSVNHHTSLCVAGDQTQGFHEC